VELEVELAPPYRQQVLVMEETALISVREVVVAQERMKVRLVPEAMGLPVWCLSRFCNISFQKKKQNIVSSKR
jgi:hypothetical protein